VKQIELLGQRMRAHTIVTVSALDGASPLGLSGDPSREPAPPDPPASLNICSKLEKSKESWIFSSSISAKTVFSIWFGSTVTQLSMGSFTLGWIPVVFAQLAMKQQGSERASE
jgi:hypothetical protein